MDLASVIAPMSVRDLSALLEAGQSPLFIPGSPTKFASLFSKEAFWDAVGSGRRDGEVLPRVSVTAFQLPLAFDRGSISRALRSGNTVCTSHIDRASPALRQLCLEAETTLGFPGSACVHCYYSPPSTGYSFFHVDAGFAVTLQLEGSKRWKYAEQAAIPWCPRVGGYREDGRLEWFGDVDWQPVPGSFPSPEEQGYVERELRAGDVLVIPPGLWHSAEASEASSLSLNLKLTPSPAIDSVIQVLRQACMSEDGWRRPFPFATAEDLRSGVPQQASVEDVRESLIGLAEQLLQLSRDDAALARLWYRNFLGSQDNLVGGPNDAVLPDDCLRVPDGVVPRIVVSHNGSASVLAQGRILHFSGGAVGEFLRDVLRRRALTAREAPMWPSAARISPGEVNSVLQKLVGSGILVRDGRPNCNPSVGGAAR